MFYISKINVETASTMFLVVIAVKKIWQGEQENRNGTGEIYRAVVFHCQTFVPKCFIQSYMSFSDDFHQILVTHLDAKQKFYFILKGQSYCPFGKPQTDKE